MPNFKNRSTELEIMDDLSHPPEIINKVLKELDRINFYLGGYAVTFDALKKVKPSANYTISDWGCGGADSIIKINNWAMRQNLQFNYVGIDASENIIKFAKKECAAVPNLKFICCDVFSSELSTNSFEIVCSSLFTHHFNDEEWIKLIQKMHSCCTKAVIINDLHRHWFAYYSIKLLTKFFSKSFMVKNDGPLSVLRSFKRKEIESLLQKGGITNYSLKWAWAFRWQLIIYK